MQITSYVYLHSNLSSAGLTKRNQKLIKKIAPETSQNPGRVASRFPAENRSNSETQLCTTSQKHEFLQPFGRLESQS